MLQRPTFLLLMLTLLAFARAQDSVPLPFHEEWDTYTQTNSGYVNGWYICKNNLNDYTVIQAANLHGCLSTGSINGSGTTFATPVFEVLPDTFSFYIYGSQLNGHIAEVEFGYIPDTSTIANASDICPLFVPYDTVTLSVSNQWQRTTVSLQPYYDLHGSAHRLAIRLCNNYSQRLYLDEIGAWLASETTCPNITNKGQDFWCMFLYNKNVNSDTFATMRQIIVTGDPNTVIHIEGPSVDDIFTLSTNSLHTPSYGTNQLTVASPYYGGYHITASAPVHAYARNHEDYTSDIATLLPTWALDTQYFVQDYPATQNGGEVGFVATEDSTMLTMTVPCNIQGTGITAGTTLTPLLMRGQCFLLLASGNNASLSGMEVTGNKPFAMFHGGWNPTVPINGTGRDHCYEQAIPTRYWGTEFIVPAARQQANNNYIRITSSEDSCLLNIDGTDLSMLNRGESYEYAIPTSHVAHITASMPVCVILYLASYGFNSAGFLGDPSSVTIPPLNGGICHSIFQNNSTQAILPGNHYLNIVCPNDIDSTLLLDGNPLPASSVSSIVGQYKVHFVDIPWNSTNQGTHSLENSQGCFVAYTYGLGSWESYAYPLGFRLDTLPTNPTPRPSHVHDTIELWDSVCHGQDYDAHGFHVSSSETLASDTVTCFRTDDSGDTILHYHLTLVILPQIETEIHLTIMLGDTLVYNDSVLFAAGTYRFVFTADNGCDSIVLIYLDYEDIGITASADGICPGDTIILSAAGTHHFIWCSEPPDPDLETQRSLPSVHVCPTQSTTYFLCSLDSATVYATITIGIEAPPVLCVELSRPFIDFDHPVVIFTDCSESSFQSTWVFSDGITLNNPKARRQFHYMPDDSLTVALTTCNRFNCCVDTVFTIPIRIRSIWFPNVFIPDANHNNRFGCHTSITVTEYELTIFNRNGLLVYRTDDVNALWDGTHNSMPLPQDAYVYHWHARDDSDFNQSGTGTVLLLR